MLIVCRSAIVSGNFHIVFKDAILPWFEATMIAVRNLYLIIGKKVNHYFNRQSFGLHLPMIDAPQSLNRTWLDNSAVSIRRSLRTLIDLSEPRHNNAQAIHRPSDQRHSPILEAASRFASARIAAFCAAVGASDMDVRPKWLRLTQVGQTSAFSIHGSSSANSASTRSFIY
jgi:hypothetical protein